MALLWLFIALGYLLLYAFAAIVPPPNDIFLPSHPLLLHSSGNMGQDALNVMALQWLDMQNPNEKVDSRGRCAC